MAKPSGQDLMHNCDSVGLVAVSLMTAKPLSAIIKAWFVAVI